MRPGFYRHDLDSRLRPVSRSRSSLSSIGSAGFPVVSTFSWHCPGFFFGGKLLRTALTQGLRCGPSEVVRLIRGCRSSQVVHQFAGRRGADHPHPAGDPLGSVC